MEDIHSKDQKAETSIHLIHQDIPIEFQGSSPPPTTITDLSPRNVFMHDITDHPINRPTP
jgi:hypothetical protein